MTPLCSTLLRRVRSATTSNFTQTLGWARSEETRQSATTWNLAAELSVDSALDLGAEVYGDDRNKPAVGVGARWHLNEQLSLNASYAVQSETPRIKLWTIGFKLAF